MWRLAGVTASSVLLALYARGGSAHLLGFVALVPWLLALRQERRLAGVLASALLMSAGMVVGVFAWFVAALDAYLNLGEFAALALLTALAPFLQPQLLAFALVRHTLDRRLGPSAGGIAGAAAWLACEWLYPKLLGDTLGHGLAPSDTLRQVADLAGAAGLTLLLLAVNEALASVPVRWRQHGWRGSVAPLLAVLLLVAGMGGYGSWRLDQLQQRQAEPAASLRIGLVQANITDYERLRAEVGAYAVIRHVLDTHAAMSAHAVQQQGAEALLWSETVYPTTFGKPKSADGAALDAEIQQLVEQLGVPLVFGSYDRDEGGEYNAAMVLEPARGLLGSYRKTHPFPLTEHVPAWLDGPRLRTLLPWAGSWQPGEGARVLPLRTADGRELNVLPLICLDAVHSQLAIDGARLGAQAIVALSNDSWFSTHPQGARLHLAVATFRSIETRLPQLRVTTNGFSAIIDESGAVVASTEMDQQAVLVGEVPLRSPPATLMLRWGDWLGAACTALLALWAVLALLLRRPLADSAAPAALAAPSDGDHRIDVVLFGKPWRAISAALRVVAALGLGWLALRMLTVDGLQVNSLDQLRLFACTVAAPLLASWAIQRAFTAQLQVTDRLLVLDQPHQRIEIPLSSLGTLRPWRLPWPRSGLDLTLASGRRWPLGIQLAYPAALLRALSGRGSPARWSGDGDATFASYAGNRARFRHRWLDHAALKFGLFPLLPAVPAFRLHQVIAYGGPFGEYYTYGCTAWLGGLLIWWGAWSLGLMLYAAALRVLGELVNLLVMALAHPSAPVIRRITEWVCRTAFYLGAPGWLLLRIIAA